ncbi:hypothetical protein RUM43_013394 [Polyplax serrata]|uniref:C2 domain-containing protein n=1 Tax=Polyplax serrata TaxID=468196 RepID=A0AAN8S715_POLSC
MRSLTSSYEQTEAYEGFSDPYCMLGIQPGNAVAPPSPQLVREAPLSPKVPACRAFSDGGTEADSPKHENSQQEKLRKHHSFKLSFKRRDTMLGRREGRDSISSAVPAKFIRATSVRPQTLSPRWNEKFKL